MIFFTLAAARPSKVERIECQRIPRLDQSTFDNIRIRDSEGNEVSIHVDDALVFARQLLAQAELLGLPAQPPDEAEKGGGQ